MNRLLLLALALSGLNCGSPKEGDACSKAGFLCADTKAALECNGTKWVKLPCLGDNGCARAKDAQGADVITCDISKNSAGDACASTQEAKGICTADQKAVLECRSGLLVKRSDCQTCTVDNNKVVCQP